MYSLRLYTSAMRNIIRVYIAVCEADAYYENPQLYRSMTKDEESRQNLNRYRSNVAFYV